MMLIVGDIGVTTTRLAIVSPDTGPRKFLAEQEYRSADFKGLQPIVEAFLASSGERPTSACFDLAGPVIAGHAHLTNLPWDLDEAALCRDLGLDHITLLNDLEAIAHAVPHLTVGETAEINAGRAVAHSAAPGAAASGRRVHARLDRQGSLREPPARDPGSGRHDQRGAARSCALRAGPRSRTPIAENPDRQRAWLNGCSSRTRRQPSQIRVRRSGAMQIGMIGLGRMGGNMAIRADRLLSAPRFGFGGHLEKPKGDQWQPVSEPATHPHFIVQAPAR